MIPKFRVFDSKFKEMEEVYLIDWQWPEQDAWINDNPSDSLIFMQSTGLHDNTKFEDLSVEEQEDWLDSGKTTDEWQGREIFEGDIVEYLDGEFSYKGVVTQDSVTCWWIKGIEPDDNFSFDDVADYTYRTCDLVVKGNIHENPELLEVV